MHMGTKNLLKKIVAALIIGLVLSIASQIVVSSERTTGYYVDICASTEGCCPGEGYVEEGTNLCPRQESISVFQPAVLLNACILAGGVFLLLLLKDVLSHRKSKQ